AEQRTQIRNCQTADMTEINRLKKERDRLVSDEIVKREKAGAPLWSLCDFADGLDSQSQAGIEAALEASGLLNAWLTASGEVLNPNSHDAVLVPATTPLPSEDAHLGTVLVPRISPPGADDAVPPYVVADILRHIGSKVNSGLTWVSPDGRWQNGILTGQSAKDAAEYIGQSARETARQRCVAELDAAIAETQ